jgi:tetraacyldisaccharide 4'-kinase
LVKYFKTKGLIFTHLKFSDHHYFSANDLEKINKTRKNSKIITTEKDFTRLASLIEKESLFYIPIEMEFLNLEMEIKFMDYLKKKIQIN